jgi:uncharacterized membrane protein YccC
MTVLMSSQLIYSSACNASFSQFLNDNLGIVGGVGIAFGIFEVRFTVWGWVAS